MIYYRATKMLGAVLLIPLSFFIVGAAISDVSQGGKLAIVGGLLLSYIIIVGVIFALDHDANGYKFERHKERIRKEREAKALPKPDEVLYR